VAATTGTAKTYDLTIGLKIDMDPMLYILTATDCPLLGTYNGTSNLPPTAGNNSILATRDCFAKKVEWDEEELLTPKTTIKAANTFATADTFIVVGAVSLIALIPAAMLSRQQRRSRRLAFG